MVVRTRFRALLLPLAFYAGSSAVASYFIWHALNGQRGLKTSAEYDQRIEEMQASLDSLKGERRRWAHKIDLLGGEKVDRDLLDESARLQLGRVEKSEVTISLEPVGTTNRN